ncbi:MAG: ElyC/SanA/YdcF family protein [Minisyncoccia bacterium]
MLRNNRSIKKIFVGSIAVSVLAILCVFCINIVIFINSRTAIYDDINSIPKSQTAIVFGAKVNSGKMSPMFEDRVISALDLYQAKKVDKILVSGDHGTKNYDEVNVAKDYLASKGVDADDIFTDYAGFDTYDTLYRAKEVFGVESAILVTQKYHLFRAIYIAKGIDMKVTGYSADIHVYRGSEIFEVREIFSRVKAYFDVIFKAKPKFLGDKIPITGDGRKSWD